MSTIEIRDIRVKNAWPILFVPLALMGLFYYFFGYLPLAFWFLGGVLLLGVPYSLLKKDEQGPCVVLDDQGVFDRRLKVGVVEWADIKRVYIYALQGIPFVCLDLHEVKKYKARQPLLLRLLGSPQRLFGMGPIAIGTSSLDMDSSTLANNIQLGCHAFHASRK